MGEVGKTPGAFSRAGAASQGEKDIKDGVGVRIYRDGKPYGFWDDESASLRASDLVVVITQGDGRKPATMASD